MKQIHKNSSLFLIVLISALFVFVGCSDMMVKMGEIVLQVVPEDTIRTTVTSYSVTGNLEGSRSTINLLNLLPSEEVVIPNIAPGKWTFTVTAYNGNADIGAGTQDIVLVSGQKVNLRVPVVFVPLPLTITSPTIPALSKVYDGTNTLAVTAGTLDGLVAGDTVSVTASATYNDESVGTGKVITVVHTLSYADDSAITGKYAPPSDYLVDTGVITAKQLTISDPSFPETKDRVYDGTNTLVVTAGSLIGTVEGDDVTVSATAAYDNKNADSDKAITVTYTLGGHDAANYFKPVDNTANTGNIAKKPLSFTVEADDKTYTGDTAAIGTVTLTGVLEGDANEVGATGIFTFADETVANGKAVGVTNITLTGAEKDNYSLSETTGSTTATISKKTFDMSGISFADQSQTYDGNAHSLAIGGILPVGVRVTYSGNNSHMKAGTYEVIATFSVDEANHETIPDRTATLTILKRALTKEGTYLTLSKAFDKNASVYSTVDQETSGKVVGDDMHLAVSASYADKAGTIGEGKEISVSYTLSGSDAANYTKPADYRVTTGAIKPVQLYIGNPSFSSTSKLYDGSTSLGVTAGNLRGVLAGDAVTVTATASYWDKNVGSNKAITVAYGLEGAQAANYIAPADYTVYTGVITPIQLSITDPVFPMPNNRDYDGTDTVSFTKGSCSGVVQGDTINVDATARYATKDVGIDKAITVSYDLSGTDAENYIAPISNTAFTGTITKKVLTVQSGSTQINADKLYDGTATAEVTKPGILQGVVSGDEVNLRAIAAYPSKDEGNNKTITVTYSLSGSDAENYTVPDNNTSFTGTISHGQLTISDPVIVKTKIYNSSDDCIVLPGNDIQGVIGTDSVQVQATARYANKHVGTGKEIRVAYTLTGRDAGKYLAPVDFIANDGEIQHKQLSMTTPTIPSTRKQYDGNTSVVFTAGTPVGVYSGDTVNVVTHGFYLSSSVENDKRIFFNYILGGSDASNYTRPGYDVVYGAEITKKSLAVESGTTVIHTEKTYDKSTTAQVDTVGTLIGVVGSEEVTLEATAVYDDANVGEDKDITLTYTISGRDAVNYSIPAACTVKTGKITRRMLTIAEPTFPEGKDRAYDGTTTLGVTAGSLVGVLDGDSVIAKATATYADKNASVTAKTLTIAYELSGSDMANYSKPVDNTGNAGIITQKALTISSVDVVDKIYDGTMNTIGSLTLDGVVATDSGSVTASGTFAFADPNASALSKTVTVTGITLGGANASNYSLAQTTATGSAFITKKALTLSIMYYGKIYDGNTDATGSLSLGGKVGSDDVSVSGSFAFTDPNASALSKTVTVTGITLGGAKASNYSLAQTTATGSAFITKKALTLSIMYYGKIYDGNTDATGSLSLGGKVGSDDVSVSGSFAFADPNAGTIKTVNVTGITLGGPKASNYSLAQTTATGHVSIGKATYNMSAISFTGATFTYTGTMHPLVISGTLPFGVIVSYSNNSNVNAGSYQVTASFTGDETNYYTIPSITATQTINKASMGGTVTVTGEAKVGQVLTANISALTNTGAPSYQWYRGSSVISGARAQTYLLTTSDEGNSIKVIVSADGINYTGTIPSSSTDRVASNGPAAPAGTIEAYNPTSPSDQNIINLTGFVANTSNLEAAVLLNGSSYGSYQALAVDGRGRARIYLTGNASANTTKVKIRVAATSTVSAGSDREIILGASRALTVGDFYQGGIVAYLSGSGDPAAIGKGLIASETTIGAIRWYNGRDVLVGVNSGEHELLGAGLTNTNKIITEQGATSTSYAAGLARAHNGGGKTDWFLPSLYELQKLYVNRVSIGGFDAVNYWSSSESSQLWGNSNGWSAEYHASVIAFWNGTFYVCTKDSNDLVRAVRYF